MSDHPDIDELFSSDDDEPAAAAGSPSASPADETQAETDTETETGTDGGAEGDAATDDEDEDLVALVEEAARRFEPPAAADAEPTGPTIERSSEPSSAPPPEPAADGDAAGTAAATTPEADGLVLQFPSSDFPPPPVFRLRVPGDWLAVPVPDALMAVRRPDDVDGFHPNVLVRARRVLAAADPGAALAELAAAETVPAGMELMGEGVAPDGPTPARWIQVRVHGPDGFVLQARHLLIYVPASAHVANVLSVVGTWPDGAAEAIGREVIDVVGSLRLFRPNPDPRRDDDGGAVGGH